MKYKKSQYNVLISKQKDKYYLYNTYSGSLCKFSKNTYDSIKNIDTNNNPENIEHFNEILSQGFIVDKDINEFNKVLFNQYTNIFNTKPNVLSFVIAPTLKCNFKCVYCFESQSCKSNGFSEDKIEDILAFIINKAENNPNIKKISIDWFGGEPMLKYKEIVSFSKKIIEYCNQKNITYTACMLTNGFLLTKEKAQVLKEECNLTSIQIPLDGMKEKYCELKQTSPEAFDTVINNIKNIHNIINIQIRLNTNNNNYDSIKQLTKYLLIDCNLYGKIRLYIAELKYFEGYTNMEKSTCLESANFAKVKIDFLNYIKNELQLKNFKFMYNKPKLLSCGLCKTQNFVIGPEGELYRCEHHVGHPENIIGDIKNERYYTDAEMDFFLPHCPAKCKKCKFYPTCLCGCKSNQILNGINKEFCFGIKYELKNSLKQKVIDIENKLNSEYGRHR